MFFAENRSIGISILLHSVLVLFAAFGLPAILPEKADPMPLVMTVELLPISEISNVKPSDTPIQKEQKAKNPVTKKPVEQSAKEPPKPTPPAPNNKTEPAPKEPEKKFDPTEGAEKKPKETPPKEEAKKPEESKPKADEFAALLNKLKQDAQAEKSKDAKDAQNTPENKTRSDAPYDASMPLSISERDSIRSQFIPCWRMPAGAVDPRSLAVRVKVELQADGAVLSAAVAPDQQGRYGSDPYFRAAADSALRAVQRCSPLKNLPADKYGSWKSMELNFDPAEML